MVYLSIHVYHGGRGGEGGAEGGGVGGWEGGWGEALLLAARHRSACARERCTFLFLRKQVFDKKNHTALKVAFLSNM